MVHVYTREYYSAIKKNNAICSNMYGPRECHTEWIKSDRGEMPYDIYPDSKKKWYKWAYLKKRKRVIDLENNLWLLGWVKG